MAAPDLDFFLYDLACSAAACTHNIVERSFLNGVTQRQKGKDHQHLTLGGYNWIAS
jgi:hypothetical protein